MSRPDYEDDDYHVSVSRRVPADWATGTESNIAHPKATQYRAWSPFGMATPISVHSGKTMPGGRSTGLFETRQRLTPQHTRRHTSARCREILHYVNLGVAIAALLAIIALIFLATVGLNNTQ